MLIANATVLQVAIATAANATVRFVAPAPDQQHRIARLKALLDHPDFGGEKVALGEALGFKSGAYLRQMLTGERPISEKLVQKIETLRGGKFRCWFAGPSNDSADEAQAIAALRALRGNEVLMAKAAAYLQGLADQAPLGGSSTEQGQRDHRPKLQA